jgi:hypothetical protein
MDLILNLINKYPLLVKARRRVRLLIQDPIGVCVITNPTKEEANKQ